MPQLHVHQVTPPLLCCPLFCFPHWFLPQACRALLPPHRPVLLAGPTARPSPSPSVPSQPSRLSAP